MDKRWEEHKKNKETVTPDVASSSLLVPATPEGLGN
jgi:hypothetical protein